MCYFNVNPINMELTLSVAAGERLPPADLGAAAEPGRDTFTTSRLRLGIFSDIFD